MRNIGDLQKKNSVLAQHSQITLTESMGSQAEAHCDADAKSMAQFILVDLDSLQ